MKNVKKLIVLFLSIFMLTTVFSGCSNRNEGIRKEENGEKVNLEDVNSEEITEEELKGVEITDSLGRVVTLDKVPEKIVSSYYLTTSLLLNLGIKEELVGIEAKAKEREVYKKIAPELMDLPGVGNSKNINVEECLSLGAELVIIPARLKEFIPQFEKLNIPVIAVDPETLDGFIQTIEIVSKAVGKEDKGNELITYYEGTISKVADLTKDITDNKKVYISGSDSILKTCTSKMYQNYLIEACGGDNVTSSLEDGYWANISVEELIKYNPDKIFLVGYASYSVEDVLNDSKLSNIDAIKNKEVYIFPSKLEPWDYPTPSSALGMLWLVNNLYPEKYSKEEYEKDATEFFKNFYGIDVSKEEIGL